MTKARKASTVPTRKPSQQRPGRKPKWQRNLLSHAIAVAGASIPGAVFATCHGTVTGPRTTTCVLLDGESLTVTNSGSISVGRVGSGSTTAVFVTTSATNVSITNDGTISSSSTGTGTGTSNTALGILYTNDLDGSLANTGTISADATGGTDAEAYAIRVEDDLYGSLTNSGTISATASSPDDADAEAIHVERLSGTLTNTASGVITATGSGASDVEVTGIQSAVGLQVRNLDAVPLFVKLEPASMLLTEIPVANALEKPVILTVTLPVLLKVAPSDN